MPKVVVAGEAKDGAKWERGFRTHAGLFKDMTVDKPIHFSVTGNEFVICFEASDLDTYMKILDSSATEEAMAFDGVKRETVKIVALDREFDPR
jgi:hypothetical protein